MNEEFSETGLHRAIKRRWPESAWLVPFLRYLTPALVGAALATLIGWLVYFFNSPQKDIARVQASVTEMKQSVDAVLALSTKNDKSQAVLSQQVTELTTKVDHQQERWERIDSVADMPPHARRRVDRHPPGR